MPLKCIPEIDNLLKCKAKSVKITNLTTVMVIHPSIHFCNFVSQKFKYTFSLSIISFFRHCLFCDYETQCARAMERHALLSACSPANAVRVPFAASAAPSADALRSLLHVNNNNNNNIAGAAADESGGSGVDDAAQAQLLGCARCAFRTTNVQCMAKHNIW